MAITNHFINTPSDYGYFKLQKDLNLLQEAYPFLHMEIIGQSVMGKEIFSIRIGSGPNKIHYNGAIHANEWITTPVLMKFLEDYAKAYSRDEDLYGIKASGLFHRTSLWLVPMVNPDGVELVQEGIAPEHPYYGQLLEWNQGSSDFQGWKANIRGVDLNDQFPAHWEEERDRRAMYGPGPRDYSGATPLSEPEAIALAEFTRQHDFGLVMAFHAQGQEIYWNYRDLEPQGSLQMASKLAGVSGYEAVKLADSDAGYKDWFIQQFRNPGFTIEVGLGSNPLPIAQFEDIYEEVIGLMIMGLIIIGENGVNK